MSANKSCIGTTILTNSMYANVYMENKPCFLLTFMSCDLVTQKRDELYPYTGQIKTQLILVD